MFAARGSPGGTDSSSLVWSGSDGQGQQAHPYSSLSPSKIIRQRLFPFPLVVFPQTGECRGCITPQSSFHAPRLPPGSFIDLFVLYGSCLQEAAIVGGTLATRLGARRRAVGGGGAGHYGLTGGWVQKFKGSYLLCFLHSAWVFKARG